MKTSLNFFAEIVFKKSVLLDKKYAPIKNVCIFDKNILLHI